MSIVIDAVIVTYCPSLTSIDLLVSSLKNQVRNIYVIDNGSEGFNASNSIFDDVFFLRLDGNKGIAFAQNVGIKLALDNDADYILLSDQDTLFPIGYVSEILSVSKFYPDAGAYAPLIIDNNGSGTVEDIMVSGLIGYKKISPNNKYCEVYQAITSGLVLNSKHVGEIGFMNEDLFIDWVDFEWCWRSRFKGYPVISVNTIVIDHKLGDYNKKIGFRCVGLRKPFRSYYITRNAFYLATRCPYLNLFDKIFLFIRSFRYILGYPLVSDQRMMNLRYTAIGLYHGLIGRLGKRDF